MNFTFHPTLFLARGNEKEISRELKKEALKRLLNCDYELCFTDKGKPFVKCENPVGISVSHDNGAVAVLVTPFEPVGIDLQKVEGEYPERVADRFFSEKERACIKASKDFYEIWCKKESLVKMTGEGISALSSSDIYDSKCIFTSLSKQVSETLNDEYVFYICSFVKPNPKIIVL